MSAETKVEQCPDCGNYVWGGLEFHICVTYEGPPCVTCGQPTTGYSVGAPGVGRGRVCANNHYDEIVPTRVLEPWETV